MNRGDRHGSRSDGGRGGPGGESSAEHRRRLEAMFSGGGGGTAPHGPNGHGGSERTFASPRKSLGRTPSEYRLRLERLRIAREPEQVQAAADVFLAHHLLPDDLDILLKVLQHPSEKVAREAMSQISALLTQGRVGSTLMLAARLDELAARATEDVTRLYVDGLRTQIARRSGG